MEKVREYERCRNTTPLPDRTPEEQRYDQNTRLLGLAFRQHSGGEAFTKLNRYENSIRRAYYKALKELKSPPPPRNTKMTKQSQTPEPPDPEPPPTQGLPRPSAGGGAPAVPRLPPGSPPKRFSPFNPQTAVPDPQILQFRPGWLLRPHFPGIII